MDSWVILNDENLANLFVRFCKIRVGLSFNITAAVSGKALKPRPRLFRTISTGQAAKIFLLQPVGENSFSAMMKRVSLLLPV